MPPAFRAEIALARHPVRPRHGVVNVAAERLGTAAGRGAAGGAGTHEVLELAAGGVPVLAVPVVAAAPGDRREGHVQPAQQPRQLRGLVRAGTVTWWW